MFNKPGSVIKVGEDGIWAIHSSVRVQADLIIAHDGTVLKHQGVIAHRQATDQELREAELVTADTRWA